MIPAIAPAVVILQGPTGALDRPGNTGECRAFAGSPGANFVANTGNSTSNNYTTANGAGLITYVFNYASVSGCATTTQTVDIYTVVKVTTTANCTWSVPAQVTTVDLFLVGGGAGGAGDAGPGGNGGPYFPYGGPSGFSSGGGGGGGGFNNTNSGYGGNGGGGRGANGNNPAGNNAQAGGTNNGGGGGGGPTNAWTGGGNPAGGGGSGKVVIRWT